MPGACFSNDFVENLFSNIRKKFPTPNALQFKQSLKHVTLFQYLQELSNTNYETDSGSLLADFLKRPVKRNKNKQSEEIPTVQSDLETKIIKLNNLELNSLYYVCDYIISSICKNQKLCDNCIDSAGSKTYDSRVKYSLIINLKCYRKKIILFFVNDKTFNFFLKMYIVIARYLPYIKQKNCDIVNFFMEKMKNAIECNTLKIVMIYWIKLKFVLSNLN